jgi:hypothetical protein
VRTLFVEVEVSRGHWPGHAWHITWDCPSWDWGRSTFAKLVVDGFVNGYGHSSFVDRRIV